MSKVHVKKNDLVMVLSGKDTDKKGKVLHVDAKNGRVLVEGVNMQTKHKKAKKPGQQSGRFTQEGHIHASNVMLVCNKCDTPTKVGKRILESGDKARVCKKCGEVIDLIREVE